MPHEQLHTITEFYDSLHPMLRWILVGSTGGVFSLFVWFSRRQIVRIDELEKKRVYREDIDHLRDHFDAKLDIMQESYKQDISDLHKKIDSFALILIKRTSQ